MKKRIIAFALCFVMLLGCLGMSGDALTDTAPLYDRLIAAQTADEFDAITAAATEEEIAALTDEQLVEISNRYAAILGEDAAEPITYASSSVNNVGPLVKKDAVQTKARLAKAMSAAAGQQDTSEPGKDEGLILDKYATKNDDGTYKITLESFVTGEVKITQEKLPADIVLVLDVSGSMLWEDKWHTKKAYIKVADINNVKTDKEFEEAMSLLSAKYGSDEGIYTYGPKEHASMRYNTDSNKWEWKGYGTWGKWKEVSISDSGSLEFFITKIDAMKIAAKNFVDQVQDKANTDGIDYRISVVPFATNEGSILDLTSVSADSGANTVKAKIDGLNADGGTQSGVAMEVARDIIKDAGRESNKVVVMFTDGEPGDYGFDESVANQAIGASYKLKNTYTTTVYTIGVFESGLNASNDKVTLPSSDVSKYMHYVSSNFKDAKDMDTPGTPTYPAGNDNYFLLADSASKMNDIFSGITDKVSGGASMQLGAETVLRDIVTSDFELVSTNVNDVHVYTADYQGYEQDGMTRKFDGKVEYDGCTVSINGNKVEVTGFDYSSEENCVKGTTKNDETTYTGKKLIVEFNIKVSDSCLGGGWFDTNTNASAIYDKGNNLVGAFPVPEVNVPRKTFDLTIQKSAADGTTIDPSQTFVFTVKGADNYTNGVNTQVIIKCDGSVTLKDLPVGKYTVTEDTNWSWRYEPTDNDKTVVAGSTDQQTVTFVNSLDNNKWLSFLNRVTNIFGTPKAS